MRANKARSFGQFARTAVIGGISALSLLGMTSSIGWAQTTTLLDPATLHIGPGVGTACQTGGCPIFGNEINAFQTQLDLYQNSGGASALNTPVLLIFGVPNDTGSALNATSIGSPTLFSPITAASGTTLTFSFGTTAFGLNGSGFEGDMTSGDVYAFLGAISGAPHFTGASNSNSFVNWSGADSALFGINATQFGIYVYALNTAAFSGNDGINVLLNGLPTGTFAVGYGETDKSLFDTPFTEAGDETGPGRPPRVPEPGTLLVFGLGLLGLVLLRRRWV